MPNGVPAFLIALNYSQNLWYNNLIYHSDLIQLLIDRKEIR